jgi:hypothetical protein
MDWFQGKSTGNHQFSHYIWCFPVNFPLNQSIDNQFIDDCAKKNGGSKQQWNQTWGYFLDGSLTFHIG